MDVCAVCIEPLDDGTVRLPGCGHSFHLHCVMNFCRYNARCPICRSLPLGVTDLPHNTITLRIVDRPEPRLTWQRYRNRRRRVLNNDPRLNHMFECVKRLRREISMAQNDIDRVFTRRCRDIWRIDPEIMSMRANIVRMQRRRRKLEQTLYERLHPLLGSEPL